MIKTRKKMSPSSTAFETMLSLSDYFIWILNSNILTFRKFWILNLF